MSVDTDWDYAHTAEARVNRAVKAAHLAERIAELGKVPDAGERAAIAKSLGLRMPSEETWAMAIDIWRDMP